MFVGLQRCRPDPLHQLAEGQRAAQVGPQYEIVDEAANQVLSLSLIPIGDDRPDRNVFLARIPAEQEFEAGQQDDEQGHPFALGEVAQFPAQIDWQLETQHFPPPARLCGRHIVPRHFQRGERPEFPTPVFHLLGDKVVGQLLPLPEGVVGILDRQVWQWRGPPVPVGLIEDGQLAQQDGFRPPVVRDMMRDQIQLVLSLAQPEQCNAHDRAVFEVHRPLTFGASQPEGHLSPVSLGQSGEVHLRQAHGPRGMDLLYGLIVRQQVSCSQDLMAPVDFAQSPRQGRHIEVPPQPERQRRVESRARLVQLLDEPQAALLCGERESVGLLRRLSLFEIRLVGDQGSRGTV